MSRPATCSGVNKCSQVKTTIAMCVSGALVITARFAAFIVPNV
jgi:glyoxylase-like metal-dependent hydrolase (beta-lactamase superfamily II)